MIISQFDDDESEFLVGFFKFGKIFQSYNRDKGGEDAFDQLVESNTCRQKIMRWILDVLFFMVYAACQNAFFINCFEQKIFEVKIAEEKRNKAYQLEILGTSLINDNANMRYQQTKSRNFKHTKLSVLAALNKIIPSIIF